MGAGWGSGWGWQQRVAVAGLAVNAWNLAGALNRGDWAWALVSVLAVLFLAGSLWLSAAP